MYRVFQTSVTLYSWWRDNANPCWMWRWRYKCWKHPCQRFQCHWSGPTRGRNPLKTMKAVVQMMASVWEMTEISKHKHEMMYNKTASFSIQSTVSPGKASFHVNINTEGSDNRSPDECTNQASPASAASATFNFFSTNRPSGQFGTKETQIPAGYWGKNQNTLSTWTLWYILCTILKGRRERRQRKPKSCTWPGYCNSSKIAIRYSNANTSWCLWDSLSSLRHCGTLSKKVISLWATFQHYFYHWVQWRGYGGMRWPRETNEAEATLDWIEAVYIYNSMGKNKARWTEMGQW